ncbi:hypothetical protein KA005_15170, partial [bacterium]|nr:hypothetical protein [bacterium]
IKERLSSTSAQALIDAIKDEIASLQSAFPVEKIKEIDNTYNQLAAFMDLIHFDYYFLLKKFDSKMMENRYDYNPSFEPINGEYFVEDLKEFDDILLGIDEQTDWNRILEILKDYRDTEIISVQNWSKAFRKLMNLKRSRVFELIIKHAGKNPSYKPSPSVRNEKIVDQYLNNLKARTEMTIQKIIQEGRGKKIEQLADKLFGTADVSRLKNYSNTTDLTLKKQILDGLTHVTPLNYVKSFFSDYFQIEICDLVNHLLIKGKWADPKNTKPLSDTLQKLFQIEDKITEFDNSLAEDEDLGRKLKNLCYGAEKDSKLIPKVNTLLTSINETAYAMVFETAQGLIIIGKNLKLVLDGRTGKSSRYLINWGEVNASLDGKLEKLIIEAYKKIYYFVRLLQFFIKND